MARGRLIVIEGVDGTGKATQTKKLIEFLTKDRGLVYGEDVIDVDFPRYGKHSAAMVENYLGGKLGSDPNTINPYLASSFYAMDRAISFQTELWGEVYRNGGIVICDRYTISNIIHQGSKIIGEISPDINSLYRRDRVHHMLSDIHKRALTDFSEWLCNYEYGKLGIPKPDLTFILTMSEECNLKLITERHNHTGGTLDIHESNQDYLTQCRYTIDVMKSCKSLSASTEFAFIKTHDDDNNIHPIDVISKQITDAVLAME